MFNFGTNLKELRLSRNITQKQLAQLVGASERGIQHYELNERKPTYDMLIALSDYFNVSIDYLVGRADIDNINIVKCAPVLSEKEEKLLKFFKALDDCNQGAILERAEMLLEMQEESLRKEVTPQRGA